MRPRVLLVDDEEDLLGIVTEVLTAAGLDVTPATNGRQARERIQRGEPFDLAVIDWSLPDVSGRDLVLLVAGACPDCGVLITTGHGDDVVSAAVLGPTVSAVLRKPFTMQALRIQLQATLNRRS